MSGGNSYYSASSTAPVVASTATTMSMPAQAPAAAGGVHGNPYAMPQQVTPEMLYWELGYMGEPNLTELLNDLLASHNDTARFLSQQKGLGALAELFSVILDYKLTNFFENYRINIVEDAEGTFLKPAADQGSVEGQRLKQVNDTSVGSTIQAIGEKMTMDILAQGDDRIAKHKQAAGLAASQTGLASLLEAAAGGDAASQGQPSFLQIAANTGMRALGVPVPAVTSYPPPPPGYVQG